MSTLSNQPILDLQDNLVDQTAPLLQKIVEAHTQLRATQPLVQCITNSVAANYVANVLLACGASPAMIDNPFEAENFTRISSALSINLGTPTTEQMQAMQISANTAQQASVPWVLDPVGYGNILSWRSEMANELLQYQPSVIRGNASEMSGLAGNQVTGKGVDSTLDSAEVYIQAWTLLDHAECIAISGESDFILSKELNSVIQVNGGCFLQPRVTATGCALGALIAAYCAVTDVTIATLSAHVHFAVAGQLAYQTAQTVGSFNVAFLDALDSLTADQISEYASFSIIHR
ncbi:MAG: hydroxyethylthiazole kinase [Acinetobacter tandoii]|uniref:hydroxyethylthiazole kinase n=1 Tax=Acinetobacter tandoii TaxID=202954 RepID=UPI003D6A21B9